jgi:hypothetical protein
MRLPKPDKPYQDFPLTAHPAGVWVKKIKGKVYTFGGWGDPDGALAQYRHQVEALQAGREPEPTLRQWRSDQRDQPRERTKATWQDPSARAHVSPLNSTMARESAFGSGAESGTPSARHESSCRAR